CIALQSVTSPPSPRRSTLSLHDALPIWPDRARPCRSRATRPRTDRAHPARRVRPRDEAGPASDPGACAGRRCRSTRNPTALDGRSEEHTSELQSRFDLVCRLLLEKNNVLLGEIRDLAPPDIVILQSLRRHLLLHTLPTNHPHRPVPRLVHLAVPLFVLVSTVGALG